MISAEIRRQVGVLLDRRGRVADVVVGDATRIYLPDIGRQRGGGGLRGLRHVHTTLGPGELKPEDITDVTKLRLDLVGVVGVSSDGRPLDFHLAHLPSEERQASNGQEVERCRYPDVFKIDFEFVDIIDAIERRLSRQHAARKTATGVARATLIGVYDDKQDIDWRQAEMIELASTAGVQVEHRIAQVRSRPDPKFVVGKGKLEEVVLQCLDEDIELLIFDNDLTPAQARSLASSTDLKIIDRTQLILDIFAQHASSRDGKLQVELAQLRYNLPRLTDMDAGLSRLTGGIGGRGPGETKLEINRRRARERINKLENQIKSLSKQRGLRRKNRYHSGLPVVAVVGYTNAGKSTLLNRLTSSDVLVADQLFATLDPTSRRLSYQDGHHLILTDTVGFIRDLPADLVAAFRATLEELEGASILLHVVDISDPRRDEKIDAVRTILGELHLEQIDEVLVLNKCDNVDAFEYRALARKLNAVSVSAIEGLGLETLRETLGDLTRPECQTPEWKSQTQALDESETEAYFPIN